MQLLSESILEHLFNGCKQCLQNSEGAGEEERGREVVQGGRRKERKSEGRHRDREGERAGDEAGGEREREERLVHKDCIHNQL